MDLTASVLAHLRTEDSLRYPHHFFQRFDNVVWLNCLERVIGLQYLHPFDRATETQARVRQGPRFWQLLSSAAQLQPKAALYLPSVLRPAVAPAPLVVLAVRHTHFRVSLTAVFDAASGTLLVALTGLRSRNIGVGAAVTCHTALRPFSDVCADLLGKAPARGSKLSRAKVHAGIASLLPHFVASRAWRAIARTVKHPSVKHVVMTGFSLGGAMTHLLSQLLRVQVLDAMGAAAPPLVVVVEGAPRTGDAEWAHCFAERSAKFAHLNLAAAGRVAGPTNAIEVDEVPTIPLAASGYHSCMPLVVVVDGQHVQPTLRKQSPLTAFSAPGLAVKDLWGLKTRAALCLASVNFLRGFSRKHKLMLQPR